jgi:serine/threonine protein kinase
MIQSIGRFQIRRELGRGAQSVVYLAYDPHLQREVAIKTVHYDRSDPERYVHFLGEARVSSILRHPNIVPIFEAGEADDEPYLVFEFVDGKTLVEVIREQGALPAARAVEIMCGVLDGVEAAHRQNIIHRDLKPSNILIEANGLPRVMDFGIAARLPQGQSKHLALAGTPNYLAPEYVRENVVSVRSDVYAAGLILLELLMGHRVVEGESHADILRRVAKTPVRIPSDLGIDDRLADAILKAVAPDPQNRYASAAQMRDALRAWADTGVPSQASPGGKKGTLEFLLTRMRHRTDFPALSESVSAINRLANSDTEGVTSLSNAILKDYALTNKILRLVNSAYFRQAGGGSISTVSRAVVVLGFDSVRNIAITLLLFEHLQDKANAGELREAFLRANLAGLLARHISSRVGSRDHEEVYICALFHGLGQLLAQYYFPEESREVRKVQQQKHCVPDIAAQQVFGISFEELGIGIAKTWAFPAAIVHSMRRLSAGAVRAPAGREDGLRLLAAFANELCDMIDTVPAEQRDSARKAFCERFAAALKVGDKEISLVIETAAKDLADFAAILHVNLKQSAFARRVRDWIGSVSTEAVGDKQPVVDTVLEIRVPSDIDAADDAQAILAAGIQDISYALVDEASVNDVLHIALETMYRAMRFRRVLLCLRDHKTRQMSGRFGFGADATQLAGVLRFSLDASGNVFHTAITDGTDMIINDVDDPRVAERIPDWYRSSVAAKTFVLFPIVIKGNAVALIYADNERPGDIAIDDKALSLLKTLRNQALLGIKSAA